MQILRVIPIDHWIKVRYSYMSQIRKKKSISRIFWTYLAYLPKVIRAPLIRSQFQIDYVLPDELVFKQAETTDEINQAFNLVYQSYVELNYMDPNEAKIRLNKYNTLSTTIILVAKWKDEVVGTLSIIPNSALGIPSEQSWDLTHYKSGGRQIAEISALSIKKGFRKQRGKLLLPLCKLMYYFCTKVLQLDGIIISTKIEVEPFYTDVLLFEKIELGSQNQNKTVKGVPATCCYLKLSDELELNYRKIYDKKSKEFNLYHFFVEATTRNILLPEAKHCLQAYTNKQNLSMAKLLEIHPALTEKFSDQDKLVLKNIDINDAFSFDINEENQTADRLQKRYQIKQRAWFYAARMQGPLPARIVDVSRTGLKVIVSKDVQLIKPNSAILIFFQYDGVLVNLSAEVLWIKSDRVIGCKLTETSQQWKKYYESIMQELVSSENVIPLKIKKSA